MAFKWDGEAMRPLRPGSAKFEAGEIYYLEEASERSLISHQHQFAWLKTAWENLPEKYSKAYPSPSHLRKRALIEAGYFTERIIDAGSKPAALRVAAYVRGEDAFAHVVARGAYVFVRKARSQAMRGPNRMTRAEFQDSKTKIMQLVADLIGVRPEELEKAA